MAGVLEDRSLTKDQKRAALVSWRSLLTQSPTASINAEDRVEKLEEIEHALAVLNKT